MVPESEMASKELFTETTKSETQRFTWKIPNFPALIKSPKCIAPQNVSFQVGAGIGSPTNFTCCLYSQDISYGGRVVERTLGFSVKLAEPFPPAELAAKLSIYLALEIPSNTGSSFYSSSYNWDLEKLLEGTAFPFPHVFRAYLSSGIPPEVVQPVNDFLFVNLTVTIFNLGARPDPQFSSILAAFKERFIQKMLQDLKTLYQDSGSWKDAPTKVVCKDGTEFNVNRGILCVRSPVFRTMFQTKMSEADNGQVKISEIPEKALDAYLHFVHTGELKDNWKEIGILEGFTYAAHKYGLKDLFQFLDQIFGHLVNQDNCGKLMNLAKTLGMEQAEKQLMDYFKREMTSIEQAWSIMSVANSVLELYPQEPEP